MTGKIRIKRKHAALAVLAACSAFSFLLGFTARADTMVEDGTREGDRLTVETGLGEGFDTMGFTCLDSDYKGGCLFVADEVIPYSVGVRYAAALNEYSVSDIRTWLNQYFADTLSIADEILPMKL